jgi:hypothetical protein
VTRNGRRAAGALGALLCTLAGAQDIPRSSTADVIALSVCVIDADIRTAAIAQMQRGAAQAQALEAVNAKMPDRVYRAQAARLVDEVYRARPPSLRTYVAAALERCAAGAAPRGNPTAADGCYQMTRWASDLFTARDAGVRLDDAIASLTELARTQGLGDGASARLAKLAASVYATTVVPPDFRAGLFFHCMQPPPRAAGAR